MSDWRKRAACRDVDPELFFPALGGGTPTPAALAAIEDAKAVCQRCPVRAECLAWAVDALPYGIAGGATEHERRDLAGARRSARPLPVPATAPRRAALLRALGEPGGRLPADVSPTVRGALRAGGYVAQVRVESGRERLVLTDAGRVAAQRVADETPARVS